MSKVLHVFDDDNITRLNVLLAKQNSFEALAPIGKQNSSSEAVWLIHLPYADESNLSNIFRSTPLRLDSHVYAIIQTGKFMFRYSTLFLLGGGCWVKFKRIRGWADLTGTLLRELT